MKEAHPLTEFIPERANQGDLETELAQDGGPLQPIVLYEGKVIEGRVRQRACLELAFQPQYRDWVLFADGDPLDWMVRHHVTSHEPSELERINLVASILPYYRQLRGQTEVQLRDAVGLSQRKIRTIIWLVDAGRLDRVLSGDASLFEAGRSLGIVSEKRGVALGRSYGHGDKFDEATQPLKRYLSAWDKKGFEFRHLNPKEAARRMKIIDGLADALSRARVDLERRSHAATLSAPPERKERRDG